jgi:TMAO reductase system protein TorT
MDRHGWISKLLIASLTIFLVTVGASLAPAQQKKITLGLSWPALTHSFWIPMYFGVTDEAKKHGVELVFMNAGGFDRLDRQISQVENLIQRHVDAILIGATSAEGVVPVVEEAARRGIAIVGLGSQPKTDKVLTRILADDYGMGRLEGEALGRSLNGTGKVAMMSGPPGLNWTVDRANGFRETLAKQFPGMQLVAEQWTPVSRPQALRLMEDWIQRFPDLAGVYTANDDLAAGAMEAIKAAGRAGKIKVVSANPTSVGMEYLKQGLIVGHAIQQTVLQGREAVRTAVDHLNGKAVERKVITPVLLLTPENLASFDFSNVLAPEGFKP